MLKDRNQSSHQSGGRIDEVISIPGRLREHSQWVCWCYVTRSTGAKPTKVPVNARTGDNASTTDSKTWSTFEEAAAAFSCGSAGGLPIDGIGYVFNDDHIGIDLDNAWDEEVGAFKPWASALIERIATYSELSPSRTGAHLIAKGSLPEHYTGANRNYKDGKVEIYSRGRFFTMTGLHISGTPDQPVHRSDEILKLYGDLTGTTEALRRLPKTKTLNREPSLSETDLIDKAKSAHNGTKFTRLWNGDTAEYGNDDSAADMALCCLLAFWTDCNAGWMDSLFRQSGLMREKWNRTDYRERTIAAAVSLTTETYNPSQNGKTMGEYRLGNNTNRNAGSEESRATSTDSKIRQLQRNRNGDLRPNLNNVLSLLENEPRFAGLVWFDDFHGKLFTGNPHREWADVDDIRLTLDIQRDCQIPNIGGETVAKAVIAVAYNNRRNSVKTGLDALSWDGVPRLDSFFPTYFGAPSTPYTIAVGRNFWISMIARVYVPGSQVDHMPVLEGEQGIGKSRALRAIGGDLYAEQHESASNAKGFGEILQGKHLVEISEMDSFNRADVTRVKQAITCTSDRYRAPYGRNAQDHPRQCVFAGTTNKDDWNRDETGARRFWPIACLGTIDVDGIIRDRDQLFAEAVHRYKAGETWWEMPVQETLLEQQKRFSEDIWQEPIAEYLAGKAQVRVLDILTEKLMLNAKDCDKKRQMRVATCLRNLGWKKEDARIGSVIVKVWKRRNDSRDEPR